ncbi:MAG: SGNH/GDSL hydrolase family protein [Paludibacter sp.]
MKKAFLLLLVAVLCINVSYARKAKSVSILGDSYSTFEGYMQPDTNSVWYYKIHKHETDVDSVSQTWWYKYIEDNKYKLCVNNSYSGATICNTGYRKADYTQRSFITRMSKLGKPDIIFIFGATNDAWAGAPIGEYKYDGFTKEDLFQFRPAMAYMLQYLKNNYPHADIYFILNSGLKEQISESVRIICKYYKMDCIELHDIDKKSQHPSVKGMEEINDQIKQYIDKKSN